jgi:hypothetical protein
MPVTPRLSRKLHQTLGEEAAQDLVNWMQQMDAQELNFARFDARLAEVAMRADLAELRQEMNVGFATLRQEMQTGLAELRQEMAHLETRLERRIADLIKWSFVFWVGAVGAIAMLAGVLR